MKRNKTCLRILRHKKDHPFVFYFMIVYLGGIFIYILIFHLLFADYSKPMPLNELGDFLAGVFAPIAFLFLYLGYKQNSESIRIQSEELRASTKALILQVSEMKQSVQQQKILSELQKVELEEKHISVTPFFSLSNVMEVNPYTTSSGLMYKHILKFTIENHSDNDARKVKISIENSSECKFEIIPRSGKKALAFELTEDEIKKYNLRKDFERGIEIEFENIFGRCFSNLFIFKCIFFDHGVPQTSIENLGTIMKVKNTQSH